MLKKIFVCTLLMSVSLVEGASCDTEYTWSLFIPLESELSKKPEDWLARNGHTLNGVNCAADITNISKKVKIAQGNVSDLKNIGFFLSTPLKNQFELFYKMPNLSSLPIQEFDQATMSVIGRVKADGIGELLVFSLRKASEDEQKKTSKKFDKMDIAK